MEWLVNLFLNEGIAHSILIFAIVITFGILLGKVKIAGISLGITWVIFVGIAFSHFGFRIDDHTLHFVKEFGLILFVYSIGMQVGPSFFSSFRKEGLTLNVLATSVVLLGVITTVVIYLITGLPITTMVGILSGAVTNTPGLGAAQQAYTDTTGILDTSSISLGYAVAYPLGVVGIIVSMVLVRYIFKVKIENEERDFNINTEHAEEASKLYLEVRNPAIYGKNIFDVTHLIGKRFVVSRVYHIDGKTEIASSKTVLFEGDKLSVIAQLNDVDALTAFIGSVTTVDSSNDTLSVRNIIVTKSKINGKTLGQLQLRNNFGVNITRINRAGIDLVATANLSLQIGDRLKVVGEESAIETVEKILGNSIKQLREPNLIAIFLGIFIGIIFGSIPFTFPGIPQPVKLGLAGGPLIIALLISRFGSKYKIVTYTTTSANLMLREIGISLFLASVGLGAGANFIDTIVNQGGYTWIGYGVIITMLPLLIVGIFSRYVLKMNYLTLMGVLAGSTTDPPALAYSNATAGNNIPAISYSTVYPLTMFLRVLTAQILILFLL